MYAVMCKLAYNVWLFSSLRLFILNISAALCCTLQQSQTATISDTFSWFEPFLSHVNAPLPHCVSPRMNLRLFMSTYIFDIDLVCSCAASCVHSQYKIKQSAWLFVLALFGSTIVCCFATYCQDASHAKCCCWIQDGECVSLKLSFYFISPNSNI